MGSLQFGESIVNGSRSEACLSMFDVRVKVVETRYNFTMTIRLITLLLALFPSVVAAQSTRGDYCTSDADCRWDNDCFPTRCGLRDNPQDECEESAPPPGTCSCVESMCTLRPFEPEAFSPAGSCGSDEDCGIDVGGGTCTTGGNSVIGPMETTGPMCSCDTGSGSATNTDEPTPDPSQADNPGTGDQAVLEADAPTTSGQCVYEFVEPITCESFRDCWYSTQPRLHPIRATEPREAPVEACVDGEIDAVCADGVCRVVIWAC
jgi:hypothetical protein